MGWEGSVARHTLMLQEADRRSSYPEKTTARVGHAARIPAGNGLDRPWPLRPRPGDGKQGS